MDLLAVNLAQILRMAGKPVDAEQVAVEALSFFERKANRSAVKATHAFIAELALRDRGGQP